MEWSDEVKGIWSVIVHVRREGSNVWRTHITREVDSLKSSEQKEIKSWELIETLFGD